MEIKTILNEVNTLTIIERSKFISYLFPCESKTAANEILDSIRKKHYDATHVCYAYIIREDIDIYKSSDDGEPSQTAGAPILNVLKRNNLTNVLCVVVRYFGGIKLGAGGLTRAYSSSAISVVENSCFVTYVDAYEYELIFGYDKINFVDKYLENNDLEIINKEYELEVKYTLLIYDKEQYINLYNKISYMNIKTNFIRQVVSKKKI